jgi:GxxExxY protein
MLEHRELTERIIGLAIEVHRKTGPGLLESVYAACLGSSLNKRLFRSSGSCDSGVLQVHADTVVLPR